MQLPNNVHHHFAQFFKSAALTPYLYRLSQLLEEGSILLDVEVFNANGILEEQELQVISLTEIANQEIVGSPQLLNRPFILDNQYLYIQRYYQYETQLIANIQKLISNEQERLSQNIGLLKAQKTFLDKLFDIADSQEVNWQYVAVVNALLNDFTIITGGPGTGKTTTVAKLLAVLLATNPSLKIALAAPTGKASARMGESLSKAEIIVDGNPLASLEILKTLQPQTIHRLLGYKNGIYFQHNAQNPLPYDVIVIDEVSMIDIPLFSKLLEAVAIGTKIIFLGDKDQLASVEAGSLLGDLCQSIGKMNQFSTTRIDTIRAVLPSQYALEINPLPSLLTDHIVALTQSHRFKEGGGIGILSKAIIQNDWEKVSSYIGVDDEQININVQSRQDMLQLACASYKTYIQESDIGKALQKIDAFRILCATREGENGVKACNERMEGLLKSKGILPVVDGFYENRPIIVLQNDDNVGLSNGDIGIMRYDPEDGILKVWFQKVDSEGNMTVRCVLPSYIAEMETVYAMTIHKSQGSEFDTVWVELPKDGDNKILTRELLYTAVTRAKNKVIMDSSAEVLRKTCERIVERGSGVVERLQNI